MNYHHRDQHSVGWSPCSAALHSYFHWHRVRVCKRFTEYTEMRVGQTLIMWSCVHSRKGRRTPSELQGQLQQQPQSSRARYYGDYIDEYDPSTLDAFAEELQSRASLRL